MRCDLHCPPMPSRSGGHGGGVLTAVAAVAVVSVVVAVAREVLPAAAALIPAVVITILTAAVVGAVATGWLISAGRPARLPQRAAAAPVVYQAAQVRRASIEAPRAALPAAQRPGVTITLTARDYVRGRDASHDRLDH